MALLPFAAARPGVTAAGRRSVVLLVGLAAAAPAAGQTGGAIEGPDLCATRGIDPKLFRKVIDEQFAALVNPQGQTSVGSYAAVDLKEAKATFAAATILGNGSVLAFKTSGAATSGLLPLLNGSTLNTELTIGTEYHFLSKQRKSLSYSLASCRAHQAAIRKLELDYQLRLIADSLSGALLRLDTVRLVAARTKLQQETAGATGDKKDSLAVELAKNTVQFGTKVDELKRGPLGRFRVEDWRASEADKLDSLLSVMGFRIAWFSVSYNAANAAFRFFDPTQPFADQIRKDSYLSHSFQVKYSVYKHSPAPYESYFWSLGLTGSVGNNLGDLEKLELVERTPFGPAPTDRAAEKRFQAFRGEYREGISSATLAGDFYWFLFWRNRAAIHLYPEYVLTESRQPKANLGAGVLLAFKGKEKPTTKVNVELYVAFKDLGNGAGSDDRVIDRKSVGFRFAFPINFSSSGGN